MIKVGTNVKSKIHDDLTGHVVICEPINNYAVVMTDIIDYEMMTVECFLIWFGGSVMKVSELIETLLDYDGDDSVTFYFLKDNVLTNCQLEDVNSYGMGIEFTIQDTSEYFEEAV